MDDTAFTKFPPLFLEQKVADQTTYTASQNIFSALPREVLVLAWASLLRGYTGHEDVVFAVNHDVISVNTGSWVVTTVETHDGWDLSSSTALSIDDSDDVRPLDGAQRSSACIDLRSTPLVERILSFRDGPRLLLSYSQRSGHLNINSQALLPEAHLPELLQQFTDAVDWACKKTLHQILDDIPVRPRLSIVNASPKLLDGPQLLHDFVASQRESDGIAIEYLAHNDKVQSLSYRDLCKQAQMLSHKLAVLLRERGVSRDSRIVIPVLLPQSLELYVALLAILHTGAAFCPLTSDMPVERVRFIADDVEARVVVTHSSLVAQLPQDAGLVLCVVDDDAAKSDTEAYSTFRHASPTDTAYVMYTSGSTGKPKGVLLSHRSVTQSLLAHDSEIPTYTRFLQFASPTFDVSQFEIWFTLFRGSTIIACERTKLLNDLTRVMNRMKVDAAELTPTVAGTLLRRRKAVPRLRLLLTIGEMLTRAVVDEFGSSDMHDGMLYGMYGPTEAAIHCTLQASFASSSRVGLIGKPLSTVSAFIVGPASGAGKSVQVLPIGHVGELAIGGHQLADGYLNRPEQTEAAFVHHNAYGMLYRTGDKARMLPDGTLECLGRIQTGQVKLRGQRVELGEVEQAAASPPGCSHAVASVVDGNLVVFCLVDDDADSTAEISKACKDFLPAFMVPSEIVLKRELPRLPSGKVDKPALEAEFRASQVDDFKQEDTSQLDNLMQDVLKATSEILNRPVRSDTKLVKLGLDSIRAIRLASSLRKRGYEVSAMDVLKATNVRDICSYLRGKNDTRTATGDSPIDYSHLSEHVLRNSLIVGHENDIQDVLPCTPLQASMLVETMKNTRAYCNWVELDVISSMTAATEALRKLISANEILRSGFVAVQGRKTAFAQVTWRTPDFVDISAVEKLEHGFELKEDDLLHPFKIQIMPKDDNIKILMQIHHALYDGWSMDLMAADLENTLRGSDSFLRPPFASVVHYYDSLDDLGITKDYWEYQLRDFVPTTFPSLSPFREKPYQLSLATHATKLSLEDIHGGLADGHHPQLALQAALTYLLSCYLGADDVCFGVVTAGRTIPVAGVEDIIGPCIATLPIRSIVLGTSLISSLLDDLHDANRAMLEHCTLQLPEIKRLANVDPGLDLFDVLFIWQESIVGTSATSATPSLVKVVDSGDHLEFKLVIEVTPHREGLTISARYQDSLIPQAHMTLLLRQLEEVTRAILSSPDGQMKDLSASLSESMLSIHNSDFTKTTNEKSIAGHVEARVLAAPWRKAVVLMEHVEGKLVELESLTYAELNSRANRLAHLMLKQGVKPDDLVCVFMEKSVHLYVSILAVLKTGAGYLPVTPSTPQSRVETILQDANVELCLVRSDTPNFVDDVKTLHVVRVDEADLANISDKNPDREYKPEDLAYAVFTSGSTGKPKGVLCTQKNLVSNIGVLASMYPASTESRLLQACSQAFDVSVFEIFFTWYSGMCLYTGTNDVLFRDLEEVIRFAGITHLSLTPTTAALVDPSKVPRVEFLVTAGEAVTEQVFRAWAGKGLWQGYGPSETTNIDTVLPNVMANHAINNIGKPLSNTSAFVISSDGGFDILPRGAVGELCFGGEQVFRGYLNMPDLTASKIYEHFKYGRIYRSGDIGRILHDGTILITGRIDDQVKIRGQRIELGEITSVIMNSEHVQDCVNLVTKAQHGELDVIVAFWVPRGKKTSDSVVLELNDELKSYTRILHEDLANALPSYMLPSALLPLASLPMTAQGKIDKRRLRETYQALGPLCLQQLSIGVDEDDSTEDWSALELQIYEALGDCKNLRAEQVKRSMSFFGLGIDSISAIALAKSIRAVTHYNYVSVTTILRHPTISKLARHVEQQTGTTHTVRTVDLATIFPKQFYDEIRCELASRQLKLQKILPCTPLQEALLSSGESYHEHTLFHVTGDVARLRWAIKLMCLRHDILRTCFVSTSELEHPFAQVVLEEHDMSWNILDAQGGLDAELERITTTNESAVDVFVPPVSVLQVELEGSTHIMISMHHAMYDGEAMSQLLAEIESVYAKHKLAPSVTFEPVLQEIMNMDLSRADSYWRRLLKGYIALPFPALADINKSACEQSETHLLSQQLSTKYGDVEAASRKLSVTPLAIFQAAWARILAAFLGDTDVCFGNVVSGRTLAIDGIERLVAPCFNTIPLRVNIGERTTCEDIVRKVHRDNADALQHQFTPLRRIQSQWSDSGEQLFDTLFILQNPTRKLKEDIWSLEREIGGMGYPVVCEIVPDHEDDSIGMTLHVEHPRLSKDGVQEVLHAFDTILRQITSEPKTLLQEFTLPITEALAVSGSVIVDGVGIDIGAIQGQLRRSSPEREVHCLDNLILSSTNQAVTVVLVGAIDSAYAEEIRKTARSILPQNCNLEVVLADHIDKTTSGRPLRKQVKRMLLDQRHAAREQPDEGNSSTVVDDIELEVRKAFAQFSDVPIDKITSTKTIYSLGLDSISSIQVAKVLRNSGHNVTAHDVLANPTSATLAEHIRSLQNNKSTEVHSAFDFAAFNEKHYNSICKQYDLEDVNVVRPCTALQSGMLSQFLHSDGKIYFNHSLFKFKDSTDARRLRTAWQTVINKHEMLRTGFVPLDNSTYAFAMVTYATVDVATGFLEVNDNVSEALSRIKLDRDRLSRDVYKALHRPAWRVSIETVNGDMYMQFSALHALYDAESLQMIMDDLQNAYNGSRLEESETIVSLLATLLENTSDEQGKHEQFWKLILQDAAVNKFPIMTPLRVAKRTVRTANVTSSTPVGELDRACRAKGITLQAALQVAWARLLSAYIGDTDITFGIVLAGRESSRADVIAFPATTTVPYRCVVGDDSEELLQNAMSFNSSVRVHQHTPLTQIQRWIGQSNAALFDTILVVQQSDKRHDDESLFSLVDDEATVEYPVSLEIKPSETGVNLQLVFWDDVLPSEQARIMLHQYDLELRKVLGIFSKTEDLSLISHLPPKVNTIPSDCASLHELFEVTADNYPDNRALEWVPDLDSDTTTRRWTYHGLEINANKVANFLFTKGIQPGSMVAVCFDKCPEASIALLAIGKAGCSFVALDPGAPTARKAFIMEDSAAKILLSTAALGEILKDDMKTEVVLLDRLDLSGYSGTRPNLAIDPQSTSYCLYTSGSTGTPKGCLLTQENAVQAMLAFQRLFAGRWTSQSRWLQFASFHFDVSIVEQFWSWSVGICVVSTPRDVLFQDLPGSLNKLGITHLDLTPSLARLITPQDVPTLCGGVFITGGEQLKQEVLDAWGEEMCIYNFYGPTECTIGCTVYYRVPRNGRPSNIGWQFDNVGTYVLKPGTTEIVPRGAVGELCISGKLVGKEYLNRPEQTQMSFPYIEEFGERIYRTSDLVRLLHDGCFDFLGRSDDQVKLRGQRLELGEINATIQTVEEVEEVTTQVMKPSEVQGDQLVAFVVSKSAKQNKKSSQILVSQDHDLVDRIKQACHERLPGYMVPTHFVMIQAIPLTVNNKSDSKAIKAIFQDYLSASVTHTDQQKEHRAMNQDESAIADVLHTSFSASRSDMSCSSNIFQLGLDSVSVFSFSRALQKAGFMTAKPSIIMQTRTIGNLAKALNEDSSMEDSSILAAKQDIAACQQRYRGVVSQVLGVDVADIVTVAPTTPLQQGMLARSLENDDGLYFNSFLFELEGDIDRKRLRNAWATVHANVSVLSTTFVQVDNGHVQAILRSTDPPWTAVDITDDAELSDELRYIKSSWLEQNRMTIMVPYRVICLNHQGKVYMALNIFHGLYDAISLRLLLETVSKVYSQTDAVDYGPPFHEVLPYGPLRRVQGAKTFWSNALSRGITKPMALDRYSDTREPSSATLSVSGLPSFEAVRRKLNVTHQAIVQACWITVLWQHLRGPTIIGHVVSGRNIGHPGAERTIGPTFNTLPFWVDVHLDDSWADVINKCHEFNLATLPLQHTPLRDITKWCKQAGSKALFDTLFVFQKTDEADTPPTDKLWNDLDTAVQADYPLAFEAVHKAGDNMVVTLVAQAAAADNAKCTDLLQRFEDVLRAVLKDPNQSIAPYAQSWASTGNRDKKPRRDLDQTNTQPDFDWTQEATLLREEIAKVAGLKSDQVGPTTSIFELSLDSIDAIQLSARMKKHKIRLPVSVILRQRTIAKMAACIDEEFGVLPERKLEVDQLTQKLDEAVKIQLREAGVDPSGIGRILPATPLQEGMIADMLTSEYTTYFNHDVLKVLPGTDMTKVKQAWLDVIARSPILRTSFVSVDQPDIAATFAQVEHDTHPKLWQHLEMTNDSWDQVYENIREAMQIDEIAIPMRLTTVQKEADQFLVLSMSHALYDGWSIGLLHEDVRKAYEGRLESRPDYAGVIGNMIEAGTSDEASSFWRSIIAGAKPSLLPSRHEDKIGAHRDELQSSVGLKQIQDLCRSEGITIQALCQLCWTFTLTSYTRSLDVTFGTVLSGRYTDEAQAMLFPTMNTVAIRAVIHGTRSEMLSYMQNNLSDVMQYQHFPLRKSKAFASTTGGELFNTLFIYQKRPEIAQSAKPLYESVSGSSAVDYPVAVEAEVVEAGLVWRAACQAAYMSKEDTSEMLRRLDSVLRSMIEDPEEPSLRFKQSEISACGLPSFTQQQENQVHPNTKSTSEPISLARNSSWTSAEQAVREALSIVSGVPEDDIGKHQTIFHIGLDSISAIKAATYLSKKKSLKITVSAMLKAGTVEKIAAALDTASRDKQEPVLHARAVIKKALSCIDVGKLLQAHELSQDNIESVLPATATQVYFLSSWQNSNGELFYPTFKYRLHGNANLDDLEQAWEKLVSQQAMLRTTFVATGSDAVPFVQCVLKNVEKSFFIDAHPTQDVSANRAPATLFAKVEDNYISLQLQLHHALYDAVSLAILVEELASICGGEGKASCTSQDVMDVVASTMPTSASSRKDFWTSYLAVVPGPMESESGSHLAYKPRTVCYHPRAFLNIEQLTPALRTHGISLQALFLAALATSRQALLGNVMVIGVYFANRASHPRLAAPTLCIVPLRIRLSSSIGETTSLFDVAKQVQADLQRISAQDIIGTGLWEIQEWTGVKVDCFVNFLVDFASDDEVEGAVSRSIYIEEDTHNKDSTTTTEALSDGEPFVIPQMLEQNAVTGTYVPSVDIEAAVRNSALDIGVFGPESMVSEDEADGLVKSLCGILRDVVPGSEVAAEQAQEEVSKENQKENQSENEQIDQTESKSTESITVDEEDDDEQLAPLRAGPRRAARFAWPRPVSVLLGRSSERS